MQHQKPCNRSAACAALDFAIPAPLTPDLGGGFRQPFNTHLTTQPSPADGSPPQVCFTGLPPSETVLCSQATGLSQFAVIPQFGIAFPGQSLARQVPRRTYSLDLAEASHVSSRHICTHSCICQSRGRRGSCYHWLLIGVLATQRSTVTSIGNSYADGRTVAHRHRRISTNSAVRYRAQTVSPAFAAIGETQARG